MSKPPLTVIFLKLLDMTENLHSELLDGAEFNLTFIFFILFFYFIYYYYYHFIIYFFTFLQL